MNSMPVAMLCLMSPVKNSPTSSVALMTLSLVELRFLELRGRVVPVTMEALESPGLVTT